MTFSVVLRCVTRNGERPIGLSRIIVVTTRTWEKDDLAKVNNKWRIEEEEWERGTCFFEGGKLNK